MAGGPPSYETATSRDPWPIVAPYASLGTLLSATLVCRQWHQTFAPYLWGHPASHFRTEDNSVYEALIRFQSGLPRARLLVRQMTHTLHLPPAHAEAYDGPHPDWLLSILDQLPFLRSLMVDELSFVDHAALLYLRRSVTTFGGTSIRPNQYNLRLLSASGCEEISYLGMCESLKHFPRLVYLDLSGCVDARHRQVFAALTSLHELRVFIMRGVYLTDEDLRVLAESIRLRVRSLDLGQNSLTDRSIEYLLRSCCKSPVTQDAITPLTSDSRRLQGVSDLAGYVLNQWTSGFQHDSRTDMSREVGITHLNISGNIITGTGVTSLLKYTGLHALDVGDIQGIVRIRALPDQHALANLTYLRIHHLLVTWLPLPSAAGGSNNSASSGIKVPREEPPSYSASERPSSAIPARAAVKHFAPSTLPALRTLVLTQVPSQSDTSSRISEQLISSIRACAEATHSAQDKARLSYAAPPGQNRQAFEHDYARSVFALETLVLEMARPPLISEDSDEKKETEHDVVAEVSAFRQQKKKEYLELINAGVTEPRVDGYWAGNVEVRRPYLQEET